MKEYVVNTIANLRKEHSITQQELAESIGVTRQTIIAMEKGNYTPSVMLAIRVAEYFKRPVENIFIIKK